MTTDDTTNTGDAAKVETTVADASKTATADTDSTTATDVVKGEGQGTADTAAKADEAKPEGDKSKVDAKPDEPQGAPEKYEAFTLPEGYTLDGERLESAHEFAKANNWTQAQAQEGVSTYLKLREAEREYERGAWAVNSQEEFGKEFKGIAEGAQAALADAEKLRPGITERLDSTSLGNHPDVLWLFHQYGVLSKGSAMAGMGGENAPSRPLNHADILYGAPKS